MRLDQGNGVVENTKLDNNKSRRLLPIDALRGLALVAMSLDHAAASVWVSLQAETYGGQQAVLASWPYWVAGLFTNIAAPIFWLLSGVSIALFTAGRKRRGASENEISRHFTIRSLVIIFLDLTLCWLAWSGKTPYLHVLLSIGTCLLIMSFARRANLNAFLVANLVIFFAYQAALPWIASQLSETTRLIPAFLLSYSTTTIPAVEFSIFGWGTLMGFGFILGQQASSDKFQQPKFWIRIGFVLFSSWLLFRLIGRFGDLTPMDPSQPWYYFLIMGKTPPSLTFLCFNLGIGAFLMAFLFHFNGILKHRIANWVVICGQVSLFYFAFHIIAYGLLGRLVRWLSLPVPDILLAVFTWLLGLALLLPITMAYRKVRSQYPNSILKYL